MAKCKVCKESCDVGEKLCEECLDLIYKIYQGYTSEQISLLFSYAIGPRMAEEWQNNMINHMMERKQEDFSDYDVLH